MQNGAQTIVEQPTFRIRPGRRGDTDAIAALLRELGFPNAGDTQTLHWVISHPEIEIFVAADPRDRPVAMMSLSHRPQLRLKGRLLSVDELVVTEAWRRRGVGTELLRRAVDRARSLSAKSIEIVIPHGAEIPAGFYERCGFVKSDGLVMRLAEDALQRR